MTGLDPIITEARLGWDKGDPWGSGMALLGAVCDLYTALQFEFVGHGPVPDELGYRPALGLSLRNMFTTGFGAHDYDWADFYVGGVAYALGITVLPDGSDVTASVADWNAAPIKMLRTMRILNRYLDLVREAGRDY